MEGLDDRRETGAEAEGAEAEAVTGFVAGTLTGSRDANMRGLAGSTVAVADSAAVKSATTCS